MLSVQHGMRADPCPAQEHMMLTALDNTLAMGRLLPTFTSHYANTQRSGET